MLCRGRKDLQRNFIDGCTTVLKLHFLNARKDLVFLCATCKLARTVLFPIVLLDLTVEIVIPLHKVSWNLHQLFSPFLTQHTRKLRVINPSCPPSCSTHQCPLNKLAELKNLFALTISFCPHTDLLFMCSSLQFLEVIYCPEPSILLPQTLKSLFIQQSGSDILPDLPSTLTDLKIGPCFSLQEFPPLLKHLDFTAQIQDIARVIFPENLQTLVLFVKNAVGSRKSWRLNLPAQMDEVKLVSAKFVNICTSLVCCVNISIYSNVTLTQLPEHLYSLTLSAWDDWKDTDFELIPKTLHSLTIYHFNANIFHAQKLPRSVEILKLPNFTGILHGLPLNIRVLSLESIKEDMFLTFGFFPEGLVSLSVPALSHLKTRLPSSLVYLDARNCHSIDDILNAKNIAFLHVATDHSLIIQAHAFLRGLLRSNFRCSGVLWKSLAMGKKTLRLLRGEHTLQEMKAAVIQKDWWSPMK